jgi:two-component system OmpR family sensor kinase/two-component system sensor histidine kinase BaeS
MSTPQRPPDRPPWWPENEPWPPHRPPQWGSWRNHKRPRRFFWRFGCALILFLLLAYSSCAIVTWLVLTTQNAITSPDAVRLPPIIIFAGLILGGAGIFVIGRTLRRATQPIEEMMDAADQVAQGDYTVRVTEHGPREVRQLAHAFNSMSERLQMNDEQRRRLLADISHELRTPLTVLQGNLEGMLDGVYQPEATRLESLVEETRVMLRLIDDLRTLADAESGTLQLRREPTDLGLLAHEVVASIRAQAEAAAVNLKVEVETDLPPIEVDPARIRQVLTNLVANALRYTGEGGSIRVACVSQGQSIAVTVSDTGRGITAQDLPHIFERYTKSSDSRGSGLGLAIAKDLVEAHGGMITAQSQIGQGTIITFTLPL